MKPRGIVLHTVGVRGDTTAAAIDKYHREHNGWSGCGYHRVVRKNGAVEIGRQLWRLGAHAAGANDTLGVCVTGDGDHEPWTAAQRAAVLELCAAWCEHYGWNAAHVCGHREVQRVFFGDRTGKTCPGLLVDMGEFRAALHEALTARAKPSPEPPDAA